MDKVRGHIEDTPEFADELRDESLDRANAGGTCGTSHRDGFTRQSDN
ncbi:MAG: hypothetical protein NTY59_16040 [Alphaproteobacteria bacterium]|nr:hypothetical protein [Alphaproteobacteria bacterium]